MTASPQEHRSCGQALVAGCALLATGLLAVALPRVAAAASFRIDPGDRRNLARFESKAPLESFDGKTHRVSGWIVWDPAAPGDSAEVRVEVDLATLDTGIALRNQHMRDNHLETDRYPRAYFRGGRLTGAVAPLAHGRPAQIEIAGELEVHGVVRPLRAVATVTLTEEEGAPVLHVACRFPLALADFAIKRPQFLMLKLGDVQQVTLDVRARAETEQRGIPAHGDR